MNNFSHLHVHTEYSILDGLAKIKKLIRKAYDDGQRAMAITDHGNMYGVFEFVDEVEEFNKKHTKKDDKFKAIIGCEVYVAQRTRFDKDKSKKEDRGGRHLLLLCKNWTGYRNLSRIVTHSFIDGFYYTPRVDMELLEKYSEGLIACSACLGGELAKTIMADNSLEDTKLAPEFLNLENAIKVVEKYKKIFGNDYYMEMQNNGHTAQQLVNKAIKQLSQVCHVSYIASNDVHYVEAKDYEAHRLLICLNTGKKIQDADSALQDSDTDMGMAYTGQEYLRTTQEMTELFSDYPDAIENTQKLVDKIESISLKMDALLPKFSVPEGFKDEYHYLEHLVFEGANQRWNALTDEIIERIQFELETVKKMGFPGYFLIVWDFISAGRKMGIRFGPGRGSAAGSILAYCLNITNVDPIKYHLLFERFLNPDRISLPDMDIDIDDSGREKVINYVIEKYGEEKVAQIVTFGTMAAKSSIKDCARVLNLPLPESDRLSKLVPEAVDITLEKAFKDVSELRKELDSNDELVKKTLHFAQELEGTVRQAGVHACAVIIGKEDLISQIPLSTSKNSAIPVTQFEGKWVENAGLLKMDFLGLKTLNIITSTLANIKKRFNLDIDIDAIPLDDEKTFQLLSRGDTTGVFQLESAGMRKYLIDLMPERFEDVIAMVALYRPGPMEKIPSFINRKQGKEKIVYAIPEMEKYLSDTYGITIYQEQVMLLSQLLAGFTGGQADTLRKAMGKKNLTVMGEMEKEFIFGADQKGHDTDILNTIWKEWFEFAKYAFNKSHATCYALIAYQTAYLKAHYPAEFLAANLTNNLDKMDNVKKFIEDGLQTGIHILPPDINESDVEFIVNQQGDIRFGLAALKNVGSAAIGSIIQEREENGKFETIFDFVKRVNSKNCNKKNMESLIYAGAFDSLPGVHRAQFFHIEKDEKMTFLEKLLLWASREHSADAQQQTSIFDDAPDMLEDALPQLPKCEPWNPLQQLRYEKEVAGFYISGHPLDNYKTIIQNYCNTNVDLLNKQDEVEKFTNKVAKFAAIISDVQQSTTKTGKDYGRVTLEDESGSYQWMLFSEDFTKYRHLFEVGKQLYFTARAEERFRRNPGDSKMFDLKPITIFYLHETFNKLCKQIRIIINIKDITGKSAYLIREAIEKSKGKTPLEIRIMETNNVFNSDFFNHHYKVDPETLFQHLKLPIEYKVELL
ncbi:MAG: DNA polymerase III subunit alpha [Bacteroidales bacterium]|jgi:DNA polymerase-3 subunit alpha|nr:DNA polymerase III subunit alpha [Bacteroidales bacterium]